MNKLRDTVWNGFALGLLTPVVPGLLMWVLMQNIVALREAHLLLIGCVALNAIWMNYFFKRHKENIGRGILSATFLWAFAFFFFKVL